MGGPGSGSPKFTPELGDTICQHIADGLSVRKVCALDGMPKMTTIFRWLADGEHEVFREQYEKAREIGLEVHADSILEIADTPLEGVETKIMADGGVEVKKGDMLGHRRLQIDARKWVLSKLLPKKYGDKMDLNHSGEIKSPTLNLILNHGPSTTPETDNGV